MTLTIGHKSWVWDIWVENKWAVFFDKISYKMRKLPFVTYEEHNHVL